MDKRLEPLFTPWHIGKCEIKNRIVMTSMGGTSIFGWMERPHFDKEAANFLLGKAKNNVGLILPGIAPLYNPLGGQWLYSNKGMYKTLKKFMAEIHRYGAKMFIQLTAGFGRSMAVNHLMETIYCNKVLKVLAKPFMDVDFLTASASANPNRWSDKTPARPLTKKEIKHFIDSFARVAKLCQDADVDGIEVHAVHEGYLLDQFAMKYTNQRTDEYGGSLENRLRFPIEIVKAIKKNCGEDYPVSLRYSVVSKTKGFRQGALPDEDYVEVGRDLVEGIAAARLLEEAGYDMLNCDNGTYDAWYWSHPPIYMPENTNLKEVEELKPHVHVPVVAAGRMDPYVSAEAIAEGKIDAMGVARQFLADEEWVTKLLEGHPEEIRPCICCHAGCFNFAHYKGVGNDQDLSDTLHMSRCAVNAETMQTKVHYIEPTKHPKRVAVIGGGIGGMEAARVLRKRGHTPVIYEKSDHLGGVFVAASSCSYKGKLRELEKWYELQMKDLGIEIHLNTEIKDIASLKEKDVVVATGSKARHLRCEGSEKAVEAIEFLTGAKAVGNRVAVIGGGLTGCEIAYELALEGKEPIIVEMSDDLIKQKGVCLANSSYLREYFALHKTPVYLESTLEKIADGEIVIAHKDGRRETVAADSVITCIGYVPTPLAKGSHRIHLVGDCKQVGNLRTVIWGAYDVAMRI